LFSISENQVVAFGRTVAPLLLHKNSSGDEIANVNFYAVRPGSYRNALK